MVCDELDLDRTTADLMVEAGVAAVVNASPFISGRYPNLGPEVLAAAGIELVDDAGKEVFSRIKDGAKIRVHEGVVYTGERELAQGESLTDTDVTSRMLAARSGVVDHLEAFAGNTVEFIRVESPLLIDGVGIPDVEVNLNNRHVLVVSDGADHVEDLKRLKPFIKEYAPVLIGVNRGADALVRAGYRPDLIVGDPEMITTNTLRSGAQVVLPAAPDGHAPGLERIQDLGVGAMTFPAAGSAASHSASASAKASAVVARLAHPRAVPTVMPTISPMAQPVRQCRVALAAMPDMSWEAWSPCASPCARRNHIPQPSGAWPPDASCARTDQHGSSECPPYCAHQRKYGNSP